MKTATFLALLLCCAGPARGDAPEVRPVPLVPALPKPPPRALEAGDEFCIQESDEEGRVHFRQLPVRTGFGLVAAMIGVPFGFVHGSPWIEQRRGQRMKEEYLEATRLTRGGRRAWRTSVRQHQALYQLSAKLSAIWSDARLSLAKRRRLLFEEWDEWTEDEAGRAARASIVGFIRRHLPADSPYAYTNYELVQLEVLRTSKGKFAPYGSP